MRHFGQMICASGRNDLWGTPESRSKGRSGQVMSGILTLCTVLPGLFSLRKDGHNYKHPRVRKAAPLVFLIVGADFKENQKGLRSGPVAQTRHAEI